MKILKLCAENIKRLSIVELTFDAAQHLVQITGPNEAGTLIVERTFTEKGTYLTVKGGDGRKFTSPQKLLDTLMGRIGFDPLSFMSMDAKEQFTLLRKLAGVDEEINKLDSERQRIYDGRSDTNRRLNQARARASAIVVPGGLPDAEPNVTEIVKRLAGVDEHNAKVRELVNQAERAARDVEIANDEEKRALAAFEAAGRAYERAKDNRLAMEGLLQTADEAMTAGPRLLDAGSIRAELERAQSVVDGFRLMGQKIDATAEVTTLEREAEEATDSISTIDAEKKKLIAAAKMPLDGLGFSDGTVLWNGLPLAQASSSVQLRVSAAIGAALNPKLRVLLARDGSLLDSKALKALAEFAAEHDLQIFLERVDESGEIGIVMEDGHVKGQEALVEAQRAQVHGTAADVTDAAAGRPQGAGEADMSRIIAEAVAKLPESTLAEADRLNASLKIQCRGFEDALASSWTPHYLARVKALSGRRK